VIKKKFNFKNSLKLLVKTFIFHSKNGYIEISKNSIMKTTIFLPDRWVKFTLNKVICVGITCFHCHKVGNVPKNRLVYYLSSEKQADIVNFHDCTDLTYLQFIKKPVRIKELKINNESLNIETQIDLLVCPNISGKTISTLAKNQYNQLFMN
jgi:hypothetical protein